MIFDTLTGNVIVLEVDESLNVTCPPLVIYFYMNLYIKSNQPLSKKVNQGVRIYVINNDFATVTYPISAKAIYYAGCSSIEHSNNSNVDSIHLTGAASNTSMRLINTSDDYHSWTYWIVIGHI